MRTRSSLFSIVGSVSQTLASSEKESKARASVSERALESERTRRPVLRPATRGANAHAPRRVSHRGR
ncbi:MAG TPA: hypothetical protein VFZ53_20370 [Polyangiaceae bacterium]